MYDGIMTPFAPLGAALRTLRHRGGQTQRQLARASGLSLGAISRWERGLQQPGQSALERLLDALGSDLPTFLQILCADGDEKPRRAPIRTQLDELERETEELTLLLDELGRSAALLLEIVADSIGGSATPAGASAANAPDPRLATLLDHLRRRGLLDRWAIEPTASELGQEPIETASAAHGERPVQASTLADQAARVERTLHRLRRRLSFYQRFS